MPHLETVEAAGGLVVDADQRILFIFKDGRWDLPKGLVESKLTSQQTALQEVEEETGVPQKRLELIGPLIPIHNISRYRKVTYLKKTQWYLMRIQDADTKFKPQKSEGITHCEWIAPWELPKVLQNTSPRIAYLLEFWAKYQKHL